MRTIVQGCLLAFASGLGAPMTATAQFEIFQTPVVESGTTLPLASAPDITDYQWRIAGLASLAGPGGEGAALLVVEEGTPPYGRSGAPATGWTVYRAAAGALEQVRTRVVLPGAFDVVMAADLTGDGMSEVVLRTREQAEGRGAIPYSGGGFRADTTAARTETLATSVFGLGTTQAEPLLHHRVTGEATEFFTTLERGSGPADLVIASYGSFPGGPTVSPDAFFRYRYHPEASPPALERLADIVLVPVPMRALVSVDLHGAGHETVVSLREHETGSYRQQLWAQTYNAAGYFEAIPIGQGNDLTVIPPDSAAPQLVFTWVDPASGRSHLTSIGLDGSGTPMQLFDAGLPFEGAVSLATWGRFVDTRGPSALVALVQPNLSIDPWIVLLVREPDRSVASLEFHQPSIAASWDVLGTFDLDGDGVDELLGSDGTALDAFSLLTREAHRDILDAPRVSGRLDLLDLNSAP